MRELNPTERPSSLQLVPASGDCVCCGGSDANERLPNTDYRSCPDCGALHSLVPEGSYQSGYYFHAAKLDAEARRRARLQRQQLARALRLFGASRAPRILEVGCAKGYFVEECRNHGYDAVGIDVSEPAIACAKARGLSGYCTAADLRGWDAGRQTFDVVVAWEILEHFDDPGEFLEAVRAALRPGGWLLGSTPNGASAWRRLLGSRWHGFDIPEFHRIYWNDEAFCRYVSSQGFENPWTRSTTRVLGNRLLWRNTATGLTRRLLRTNALPVRAALGAAIWAPQKAAEAASNLGGLLEGDTLIFAAQNPR